MSRLSELLTGSAYVVCWTSREDGKENWRHVIGEEKLLRMWDAAVADAGSREEVIAFRVSKTVAEEEIEQLRP